MLRIVAMAVILGLEIFGFSFSNGGNSPLATAADSVPVQQVFPGIVRVVSGDKLTLETEGGTQTFLVPPSTKIWHNGSPATLADLRWRDVATILGEPGGNGLVARFIYAQSPM